ncbi:MAG: hypothetical protein AAF799_06450 [Myxococcota bacterium]
MGHPIHRYSAVARPVEPRYPTNLAILLVMGVTVVALSVTSLIRGAGPADALLGGLLGSLILFTTWALTREIAPDDNVAAFVALAPVTAAIVVGVYPLFFEPMLVLVLARLVNRTVGPPAKTGDRIAILVFLLAVGRGPHSLALGLAAVAAFGLDALLPTAAARGWLWAGLAAVVAAVAMATGHPEITVGELGTWTMGAWVVAVLFAVVIATQPAPSSECDTSPHALLRRDRVQGAMVITLVAISAASLGGETSVQSWAVGWSACIGATLTRPWNLRGRNTNRTA